MIRYKTTEEVYTELDAARLELDGLRMVNAYSLDTPEKKLAWDVAYARANERLNKAEEARVALVHRTAFPDSPAPNIMTQPRRGFYG